MAMDRTKSAVINYAAATGTLGLGLGVVACQVGLYVGAATTNIVLDGVIATKNIGSAIVAKGIGVGYSVEQQVAAAIEAINLFAKELRKKIEMGAIEVVTTPGDVVLRIIRTYSAKLNEQLGKLRESGAKLLGEAVLSRVSSTIAYVERFDQNLANAQSIEEVNVQVFEEAKQKFQDVTQWSSGLMTSKVGKAKSKLNGQ